MLRQSSHNVLQSVKKLVALQLLLLDEPLACSSPGNVVLSTAAIRIRGPTAVKQASEHQAGFRWLLRDRFGHISKAPDRPASRVEANLSSSIISSFSSFF